VGSNIKEEDGVVVGGSEASVANLDECLQQQVDNAGPSCLSLSSVLPSSSGVQGEKQVTIASVLLGVGCYIAF
jgi:hypothetical protein